MEFFLINFLVLIVGLLVVVKFIREQKEYHPIVGTVFNQFLNINRLHDYLTDLACKYKTYRILGLSGSSDVYTSDPANVEYILRTNFPNYVKLWYNYNSLEDMREGYSKGNNNQIPVEDLFGHGIFFVDGDMWRQQRKVSNLELNAKEFKDDSSVCIRINAAKVAQILSTFTVTAGGVCDIHELLDRCTSDSIFKLGFGVDLNSLGGSSEGTMFIKAFDNSYHSVFMRYVDPFWKVKKYFNIGSEAIIKENLKVVDDCVYGFIQSRKEHLSEQVDCIVKQDILSRFLVESNKDPSRMDDKYMRDIMLNFIFAAKDSTANSLSWFIYMLCKHPTVEEKIVQEINEVIQCNNNGTNIFENFAVLLTDNLLGKMQYLHAALTETLRLYPPVPMDWKCAEAADILPDGYRIKKGDYVYYMPYAMGRMTYIWGEDAEEFRPERWLNDGVFQPQSSFKFVAFNAGPRICVGKDFAYRQMKIVAMVLLRFFKFELEDDKKGMTYRTLFTLPIEGGLHLRAAPRGGT